MSICTYIALKDNTPSTIDRKFKDIHRYLCYLPTGGGGGAVTTVFGRAGAVVAATNDYIAAQVTNAVDQTGSYANPAWISSLAYSKLTGIPDAVADGATKGISTFTASDFNSAAGIISLDYTNGQAAGAGAKGFLTAADWTTFNGKANTALSNLASVSINTALIPQTGIDLGAAATAFRELYLFGSGTFSTTSMKFTSTPTGNRVITFPDASITVARIDAAQTFTGIQTFSSPLVGTQATSDNSTKAASTAYVTTAVANAVAGINPAVAVQAASTANVSGYTYNNGVSGIGATLTQNSAAVVVIDGYTLLLNDRVLFKNQTTGANNGVYLITTLGTGVIPAIFTRALDYDQPSDMNNTGAIPVVNGTVNVSTSWLQTSQVNTVGTDSVTYTQFSYNPSVVALTTNTLAQFAATTSAQLATLLTDETGSGANVFATTPTLVTPVLGAATATSINGLIVTTTAGTLTIANNASASLITSGNFGLTLTSTATTNATLPAGTNNIGYLEIPQNSKSAAYTTVLADSGKHIYHPGADTTARTWTIDSNANVAYPIGTAITFVNDTSAGTLTIAITSDTLVLAGAGTTGSRTLTANGVATAIKITSTRWMISGTNLT